MRVTRLELKAFGPFTDKTLDFSAEKSCLHIIFGANEAGKSSSLRALKALLYGFPQQSPDNFTHNYDQLLVGGCLVNSAGQEIYFQRRKKRHGDILDAAGNPLEGSTLAPYLSGVESELFETLYGIDHGALIQGGEEILAQKGEVGQALFAAGSGISSLRSVLEQLESEALDLFKPTGQLPAINRAIKRMRELQKEMKDTSLSAKAWRDLRRDLEQALATRKELEKKRDANTFELHRLQRLAQAIPELAILQSYKEQLKECGAVTPLDPGFFERYQQVSRDLREVGQQLLKDNLRLGKLLEKRNTLPVNRELIAQAEKIDDFHQRLGEYRKGQKDKPERNGMRLSLRIEAARLLRQIRPDLELENVELLRPVLAKKRAIHVLIPQHETIQQKIVLAQQQGRVAAEENLEIINRMLALSTAKGTSSLQAMVKIAQKDGNIDEVIARSRSEISQAHNECLTELKRIGLIAEDLAGLMAIALPRLATVQQFAQRFAENAGELRDLERDRKKYEKELNNVFAEIKKTVLAGEIPSLEDLQKSRDKRDYGWQLVRKRWLRQEDVSGESQLYDPVKPLPEAYEQHVAKADEMADRLRREADRVAAMAALQVEMAVLQQILADNSKDKEVVNARFHDLSNHWQSLWQPLHVVPMSPMEMSDWLVEIDTLRFKAGTVFKKEQEVARDIKRRDDVCQALIKELKELDEAGDFSGNELTPILVVAETLLEKEAHRQAEFLKLVERQEKVVRITRQAEEDRKTALDALGRWQESWRHALSGLGLVNEVSTIEAVDYLETLQGCFDKLREAEDLQKRIDGIDRDAAALGLEVRDLLHQVAPEIMNLPLDQVILQLRVTLSQAQSDTSFHDQLSSEIEVLQDEIAIAKTKLSGAETQMEELVAVAKCHHQNELPEVIGRYSEYQRLSQKISDTEVLLAKIGAGVSHEELARQAAEMPIDALQGLIGALQNETEDSIHPEINSISQVIGEHNSRLAAMDGSAKAAEIAEEIEGELAKTRRLVERYTEIKLSAKILQHAIERYRETHQDPIMTKASQYFQDITLRSFVGLRTDVDERNVPILVGVRPDNTRLTVDKMSSGTRDQVFLALRLATLEWRLTSSEPLPFVVDDILINFDDERSRATLKAMAKLGEKNQVILFTHHGQIVEEALRLKAEGVKIHMLML